MIKTGNIWHSPTNVYWHIQKLTENVGEEAIEKQGKYQNVREARVGAVVALVMFKRLGKPTFLQLYKPDPPDVILMQLSKKNIGQRDITQLEITSYIGEPRESLLEQLKRTKTPPGIHIFSENHILIVNVGVGLKVDYDPIRRYLNKDKIPFPVWTLQEKESYPDTIARVVIVNPEIYQIDVNVGESVHNFEKLKFPGVIRSKRVSKVELVRAEPSGRNYEAPWDTIGK